MAYLVLYSSMVERCIRLRGGAPRDKVVKALRCCGDAGEMRLRRGGNILPRRSGEAAVQYVAFQASTERPRNIKNILLLDICVIPM